MGAIRSGDNKIKLMSGDAKVNRAYAGDVKIYSAGNIVTYYIDIDSGTVYQEEVDEGASCLSPKTFTPVKSTWGFVGWRQDTAANGNVLSSLAMGDAPVTLYAVFRQTVTLSYSGNGATGGSTAAQTGYRYYNNGNVANPSFTLAQNGFTRSNATFYKWALGSLGGTQYAAGTSITLSTSTIVYAKWYVTQSNSKSATCSIARPYKTSGDWTGTKLITSDYVSGVTITGSVYNDSTGTDGGRCDVRLYVNDAEILYSWAPGTSAVSKTLGASSGITIKLLVHPHAMDDGGGSFSGTVTYTTTTTTLV